MRDLYWPDRDVYGPYNEKYPPTPLQMQVCNMYENTFKTATNIEELILKYHENEFAGLDQPHRESLLSSYVFAYYRLRVKGKKAWEMCLLKYLTLKSQQSQEANDNFLLNQKATTQDFDVAPSVGQNQSQAEQQEPVAPTSSARSAPVLQLRKCNVVLVDFKNITLEQSQDLDVAPSVGQTQLKPEQQEPVASTSSAHKLEDCNVVLIDFKETTLEQSQDLNVAPSVGQTQSQPEQQEVVAPTSYAHQLRECNVVLIDFKKTTLEQSQDLDVAPSVGQIQLQPEQQELATPTSSARSTPAHQLRECNVALADFKKRALEQSQDVTLLVGEKQMQLMTNTDRDCTAVNSPYYRRCLVCNYESSRGYEYIVNHYVNKHPATEVYIARIPAKYTVELIRKMAGSYSAGNQLRRCFLCDEDKNLSVSDWVQHITEHTGEFEYECTVCGFRCASTVKCLNRSKCAFLSKRRRMSDLNTRIHQHSIINGDLVAYLCVKCNYTQLQKSSVQNHLKKQHNLDDDFLEMIHLVKGLSSNENMDIDAVVQ